MIDSLAMVHSQAEVDQQEEIDENNCAQKEERETDTNVGMAGF